MLPLQPLNLVSAVKETLNQPLSIAVLGYEAKSVPIEDIIESLGLTLEFQLTYLADKRLYISFCY